MDSLAGTYVFSSSPCRLAQPITWPLPSFPDMLKPLPEHFAILERKVRLVSPSENMNIHTLSLMVHSMQVSL